MHLGDAAMYCNLKEIQDSLSVKTSFMFAFKLEPVILRCSIKIGANLPAMHIISLVQEMNRPNN